MTDKVPKQVQDKLMQFQNLQQQIQLISLQKQQMMLQNTEIENSKKELEAMKEGKVYRIVGPILIESSKDETVGKLGEDFELNKTRISVLEKQEKKMAEKMNEMRNELQSLLGPPKA